MYKNLYKNIEINLREKIIFDRFNIFQITHMHCEKADIWETGLHASAMCVIKDQSGRNPWSQGRRQENVR